MSECKRIHLSEGEVSRIIKDCRDEAIEECARVADDLSRIMGIGGKAGAKEIAAAIRALKASSPSR